MIYRAKLPDLHLEADCTKALTVCTSIALLRLLNTVHGANAFS
jgi:hypothetical protein